MYQSHRWTQISKIKHLNYLFDLDQLTQAVWEKKQRKCIAIQASSHLSRTWGPNRPRNHAGACFVCASVGQVEWRGVYWYEFIYYKKAQAYHEYHRLLYPSVIIAWLTSAWLAWNIITLLHHSHFPLSFITASTNTISRYNMTLPYHDYQIMLLIILL